jgi:hypothetical protein
MGAVSKRASRRHTEALAIVRGEAKRSNSLVSPKHALLRVSAEDARADSKLRGMDQDFEEAVDAHALDDQEEAEDGIGADGGNIDSQAYYDALLGVLSSVQQSEIKDMPVSSALRHLDEEARTVEIGQNDSNAAAAATAQRGRHFYTTLQDMQDSPFRGMGLLSQEEIQAISTLQKKEDASIRAHILGGESNAPSGHAGQANGSIDVPRRPDQTEEMPADGVGVKTWAGWADASRSGPLYVICRRGFS